MEPAFSLGRISVLILKRVLPILLSLLCVASPVELVPDFLPGLGWIDDLLVVGALLWYISLQQRGRFPWNVFTRLGGRTTGTRDVRPDDLTADFSHMDAYELLEVPRSASAAEIKAAYKRAVSRYHPDKVSH